MSLNLDVIDHRLLSLLQQDATLSMDALAEAAHLSRNACWRRIRVMETAGVIRGRVALVDPGRVGCGLTVFVMVRTNQHEAGWMARFDRAVKALPQVVGAYRVTGDLDYILRVRIADVADYDRFYKDLTGRVALSDVSASFVMEEIKETTAVPLPG